ncbi:myosin light chain kinase family member 4 [Tachysurus vachellii]|uniref:myosin light chain kinase family member 4 n=1 Tax=Tachysurus vachellii TaxID=175792 RepID=UPI00296B2037|nr:myosin light chain kinase family member 4 [Tachysurus vachellii]
MVTLTLTSETAQTEDNKHFDLASAAERRTGNRKKGGIQIKQVLKEMGGKEKKILNIAKYEVWEISEGKHRTCGLSDAVSSPVPHSACLGKHVPVGGEGRKTAIGRMDFFRHLERVETLRCYWELKHIQLEGLGQLKEKECTEKPNVCLKLLKSQKKKPPDETGAAQDDLEKVQTLNQQNSSLHRGNAEANASVTGLLDFIQDKTELQTEEENEKEELQVEENEASSKENKDIPIESKINEKIETSKEGKHQRTERKDGLSVPEVPSLLLSTCDFSQEHAVPQKSYNEHTEPVSSTKRRVENLEKDDLKKSRVEERSEEVEKSEEETQHREGATKVEPEKPEEGRKQRELMPEEYIIDCSPPPPAPFDHRVVTTKTQHIAAYYTINREEMLGGGRFGMVHKCVENTSGLTLAAKIIKTRNQKEKEVVKSEIEVMNQLNHASLIQLYAAYESRNDITLIMEYVEGGELFDRIIDENYNLTELDTVLLIRQITEGLQYMHKMYILHLDLKPENILCVSRETNKIKIIDFGLARRYKPREKLRVNFGTPEFLAPEVINYEFVSFPTDMWSLGVITYMLLSGLSPFLGDDDNETLNNILECKWSFEEAEFADISDEAKDFITRLLIKSKSWRMSASQSLKHPWLSDRLLHNRLHQKRNKCHSAHAPPAEG